MSEHDRGLYEILITEALDEALDGLPADLVPIRESLRSAEAADRISLHFSRVLERALSSVADKERAQTGVSLARRLIELIDRSIADSHTAPERPLRAGEILRAIFARLPDGRAEPVDEPLIPLLDTTLLTNAPGEPRVLHQLMAEVDSAHRIDLLMAFIRMSGIAPMLKRLRAHTERGRTLRILTTTYTNSTEAEALNALADLGAEIKVSYDTSTTRLHAKVWAFHRKTGFSTAYIGSSNLTHSAQVTGLEWNVRVSGARNPDVIDKVSAVFESYWNKPDFVLYDAETFRSRTTSGIRQPLSFLSPIELRPEPFQERMLEQIALSRERGHHRNLLVSATGTGKTVMAAIDYVRLREKLPRARLLFVAHREEILKQALATFRQALHDHSFGELWVGGYRPHDFDHVFASIQSLHAARLETLRPDHFDIVIIDEFHHAAASTYRALIEHVEPKELLGLTATPERSDGLSILHWFDNRIAAELRVWDAIDQQRLSPFIYYGIHDGLDLRQIPWRRGQGYDVDSLSNLLTANDIWAKFVIRKLEQHVPDPHRMRALGFCVSVSHARFMARIFNEAGIRAVAIWSDTPDDERRAALADLKERRVSIVFSVDLFNEGVDVPAVDTLLMLRPTDSPTLFLQQLGRGLRRYRKKTACTVLDFVGHHRTEFRFDRRFRALLGGSRKDVESQVRSGFPFLPAGCHIELDRVATDIVLSSIRNSLPSRWTGKVEELRQLLQSSPDCTLSEYLEATDLELEDVYSGTKSWSDLSEEAGATVQPSGPQEQVFRRACGRLLHIDDPLRIEAYERLVRNRPQLAGLDTIDTRLLRMLLASITDRAIGKDTSFDEATALLFEHPQVLAELLQLFQALRGRVEHMTAPLTRHPNVPLRVHARYTRIEILAGFGVGDNVKVAPWQTGIYWAQAAKADLLAFTLDKTTGEFSPTTRYRDYAISRDLIHWESQSVTRAESETGLRYQQHLQRGTSVMLFARRRSDERAFYFLGPARYVSHEGEQPMAITWRLEHPLPGDLFAQFAVAVA